MQKTTVTCDCCSKRTDGPDQYWWFQLVVRFKPGHIAFLKPHPEGITPSYDICEACMKNKLGLDPEKY
jgi:hypothetical protein